MERNPGEESNLRWSIQSDANTYLALQYEPMSAEYVIRVEHCLMIAGALQTGLTYARVRRALGTLTSIAKAGKARALMHSG